MLPGKRDFYRCCKALRSATYTISKSSGSNFKTRKWFPLWGERAHSLKFLKTPISILIHSIILLSSSASRANLSCVVVTIFTNLAFLSSSVSMTNLSRLVAASFSSLALSSSVSMANLSCLLVTTFSGLKLLSYSLSSPRFHLLRVGRRCYSVFFYFLTFASYPQHTEAPFASSFSFLSERFFFCPR